MTDFSTEDLKGVPTFEEFKKNPYKWIPRPDQAFEQVDKGSEFLGKYYKKIKFEIEGYRCDTLEEVERIAKDYGIPISDLKYEPVFVAESGYYGHLLVKFLPRTERIRRDNW